MKKILFLLLALVVGSADAGSLLDQKLPPVSPPSFDFSSVSVPQAIQLIYSEALKQNYIIAPEVLGDQRVVSFRYNAKGADIHPFVVEFLKTLGYSIETKAGVDFVAPIKEAEKVGPQQSTFIYSPRYRNSGYLSRLLTPLFKGRFSLNRAVAAPVGDAITKDVPNSSAAGAIDQDADVLIFIGTDKEVASVKGLLTQIDLPVGEIVVRAAVYEVSTSKTDGSAVQLALSLLGGRVGISLGSDVTPLAQSLTVKAGGFSGVLSALSSDSRFNVVTQPVSRVRSGETSKLVVGQSVPTLASVSYQGTSGTPVQSITYKDAGTILTLSPVVRGDSIDLKIDQQISNFQNTTTGLSQTPTLLKREMSTSITTKTGQVLLIGGLTQTQKNATQSHMPFLSWLGSHQNDESLVDVLIIIQVDRVEQAI